MPAVAETSDEGLEEEDEDAQGKVEVGKSKDSSIAIDGVHVSTEKAVVPNWDEAAWSAEQEVARYASQCVLLSALVWADVQACA